MQHNPKIISYARAQQIAKRLHKEGKKIVFKTGCFDVVHIGHIRALEYCKGLGDVFILAIGSDKTLHALKGPDRPIFPEELRAEVIAALACVDYVLILKEPLRGRIDHEKIISLIRPHYYMLPPDDKALQVKRIMAKKYGVTIKLKPETKGKYISTSQLISRILAIG
ncbi:MAG: adenylyltransferase/cytidyltransferase family protein [Patescibacteria group bacterium]